ncbi:MAG TPA: OmpA family protein [Geminicoccaceae bacterium]|nr:OmpA family protein [Geminicoccaceae bacterium]
MDRKHFWLVLGVLATAGFLAASPGPALAQQAEVCNPVVDASGRPVTDASGNVVVHAGSVPCPPRVAAVAEPPPVAPAAPPPPTAFEETVNFDFDRSEIRPEFMGTLDQVAEQLQRRPEADVFLVGHADAIGDPQYNIGLGERRAESVAEYLTARGVGPDRLVLQTRGEAEPIATNDTPEGRAQNRRVEISTAAPATS